MRIGVALGGGGPVGTAWYAGLFEGLRRHGCPLDGLDVVVGTSAGAAAGAWLTSRRRPSDFAEALRVAAEKRGSIDLGDAIDLDAVAMIYATLGGADGPLKSERVRELCALGSSATADADMGWFIELWSAQLPDGRWPEELRVAVVDVASGDLWLISRRDEIDLPVAVAASAAAPGLRPAIRIGDRLCADAGVRSSTNADVLFRFDISHALVINPVSVNVPLVGSGIARSLRSEVGQLRDRGIDVVVIEPSDEDEQAMGDNPLDLARVDDTIAAGEQRGRLEAEHLAAWVMAGRSQGDG